MAVRAVLYARYSTDRQSDKSADDQLRLLRQHSTKEGWHIVAECRDEAISGKVRQRPGLLELLRLVEVEACDVVLAESLDRLSRDQEDIAAIYKRVQFRAGRIVTLSQGTITPMHIGFNGTMSAVQLVELGEKVRRGQIGRVAAGRVPGSLSFGYSIVREFDEMGNYERGRRAIREDQADIVREIFARYVAGTGAAAIAKALNARHVKSPRGGLWRASTIIGSRSRRNGILNNEMYRGRIIYNRQSFRTEPDSRRRQARVNDADQWVTGDAPDLRIVTDDIWNQAQARMAGAAPSGKPWLARRPKRLLSGIIRCGCCGGVVTIIGNNRWACSTAFQTGTCDNKRSISNVIVERKLWAAMLDNWLHPDVVAAYVDEYRKQHAEVRRAQMKDRAGASRRLAAIDIELDRIADAIVAGIAIERLKVRADGLEAERQRIERGLADFDAGKELIMHPGLADGFRRRAQDIRTLLDGPEEGRQEAREQLRGMIDSIVVTPKPEGKGMNIELHGHLAAILGIKKGTSANADPHVTVKVVAGVGFEPTTFRL